MRAFDPFISTLTVWSEVFMHNTMRSFLQFAQKTGMSMSQIGALFWVLHKGYSDVSRVGEELGISTAAASQMLERLVQLELIRRTENPQDRRYKQIELTEKGRQVLNEGICARRHWFEDLAVLLTPEELVRVTASLELLIERAGQLNTTNE